MNLYRHFGNNGAEHSATDAFLLALPSYFIYPPSVKWGGSFASGFGQLMKEISGNDANAFNMRFFTRSSSLVFDSPRVWDPVVGYDAQAAVLYDDDVMVVCFRGTEAPLSLNGFTDWFGTNLTFQLRDAPARWGRGVRIHRGFHVTLNALYEDIHAYVRRRSRGRRVYLTGHSTGAALATLCAFRFRLRNRQRRRIAVEAVYTFGSPRVGNNGFAQAYSRELGQRTFRWVNHLDLAAQVPDFSAPPTPTAGLVPIEPYVHVGRLNYVEDNGSASYDLFDHDPMTTNPLQLAEAFGDHNMRGYLYRMFDNLSRVQRTSPLAPAELVRDDVWETRLALDNNRTLLQVVGPRP